NDPAAVLPADATLTNGVGTFGAILRTVGSAALTATDAAAVTGSAAVAVSPAAALHFVVSAPISATAGVPLSFFTVTVLDAFGNVATGYNGTIHFTSSDAAAILPGDTTLTAGQG